MGVILPDLSYINFALVCFSGPETSSPHTTPRELPKLLETFGVREKKRGKKKATKISEK